MRKFTHIDADLVRSLLDYDPETGILVWKHRPTAKKDLTGNVAGSRQRLGYIYVMVQKKMLQAHRVAWAIYHGSVPDILIDHKDGDPANNRISNLRLADSSKNQCNKKIGRNSTTGVKGVSVMKDGRFRASIKHHGKKYALGRFVDAEMAHAAYRKKAAELFGEFARFS